jgi:hypothetical protein
MSKEMIPKSPISFRWTGEKGAIILKNDAIMKCDL